MSCMKRSFHAGALLLLLPIAALARSPLTDSLDVLISSGVERESSVFVSPLDPNFVLVSSNVVPINTGSAQLSAWISTDGGRTWSGGPRMVPGVDPAAAISADPRFPTPGRLLVNGYRIATDSQLLQYKDPDPATWTEVTVSMQAGKPSHLWVDNSSIPPHGPTYNLYCGWGQSLIVGDNERAAIKIVRSADGGATWLANLFVPEGPPPSPVDRYNSPNIHTGRSGAVYAVWVIDEGSLGGAGDLGFAFSKNGGLSYLPANPPYGVGVDISILTGKEICSTPTHTSSLRNKAVGAFTFPILAVDRSDTRAYPDGGDHLYVVWADRQLDGSSDIRIMKGFGQFDQNGIVQQVSWDTHPDSIKVVNQDVGQNDQWWPWITWDECTGMLAVVFMDSRNPVFVDQAGAETYVAVSPAPWRNGGQYSWTEVKVSDRYWSGDDCIQTPGGGLDQYYDYIGIAAGDGRVFPVWSDNAGRLDFPAGSFVSYTSPIPLWGVLQSSVSTAGIRNASGGMISIVGTWDTNLPAPAGDQIKLLSPTGQPFEGPEGVPWKPPTTNHRLESPPVPCQYGTWSQLVSSRRSGGALGLQGSCQFKRESDWATLQVVPFASAIVPSTTADKSQGVAWGDFDGDGDLDVYVSNNTGTNRLFANGGIGGATDTFKGVGDFVEVTTPPLDDSGPGQGAVWGDYDNDGLLDLCLANGKLVNGVPVANKLFKNTGGGHFVDVTTGSLALAEDSRAVTWVDFNNDGKLDLYVVNHDVPSRLLQGSGGGAFTDVSSAVNVLNGVAASWGDYDNDGDADLYVVRNGDDGPGEECQLFRNDGNGVFSNVTWNFPDLAGESDGQSAAWGDYNNDRYLDLVLVKEGVIKLFRNNGGTSLNELAPLVQIGTGRGVAWGDFDNDGDLDLYLTNDLEDELLQNDNGSFGQVVDGVLSDPGAGRGVAWGDEDGDGDLDLYYANDTGGNKSIRYTPCPSNHWLQVNAIGAGDPLRIEAVANRSAIGARVRTVFGGGSRIQEISGGSGRGSQNSLTAQFGLGIAAGTPVVDTLEVRFPGVGRGERRRELQVFADQVVTVREWIYNVQETSTQFCQNNASRWQLVVSWRTVVPTSDPDVLEIYQGNTCETGGAPFATRTATPTQGGLQHSVTYEVGCSTGTWKYAIRSSNGTSVAAELCRTVVVSGCPSCGTQCRPACELE